MASKKKQQTMVFERIAANSPSVASEAWSSLMPSALKPRNTSKGSDVTGCKRSDVCGRTSMHPTKEVPEKSGRQLSTKHDPKNQSDNLSPDCCCRGIKVTLDNNNMWNQFYRCKTEMIVTKEGSRMFPSCRFRVSGLQLFKNYVFVMNIQPADDCRYKWDGTSWRVDGKAERHVKSQPFFHHDSPSVGQHWMQNPVSFYRLKLTSNILDKDEKTVLHPAHRYHPLLHVIQIDKAAKDLDLNGPNVVTFAFPQMEFMAVTAYQNTQFVKLKVDYNPFAKGLKEEGVSSWGLRLKGNTEKDSGKDGGNSTKEQHPVKKSLQSLLANHKPRSSKTADSSVTLEVLENSVNMRAAVEDSAGCSSVSPPAQKLFSDLIREAHVSLQRCDVDQLCVSEKTKAPSVRANRDQAKQRNVDGSSQSPPQSSSREGSTVDAVETNATKKKVKESRRPPKKDVVTTVSVKVSEAPVDKSSKLQEQSEASPKLHKRPAPLPLPALARFLKQHSLQSKKAKSQQDHPPTNLVHKSAFQPSCPRTGTEPQKDTRVDTTKAQLGGSTCSDPHRDSAGLEQARKSNYQCSSLEKEMSSSDRTTSAQHGALVLPHSDRLCCNFESTLCPSDSVTLCGPGESVLPSVCLPHLPPEAVSTSLPSVSKSFMPLPDPNCSSFMFEPLSPASSPEPLPTLPTSLALSLDPNSLEQAAKRPHTSEMLEHDDSVFKWHTLLPPSENQFIDPSFPTFQQLPLPMTLHNNTQQPASQPIYPSHGSIPSFQDNEQSLPFPAELSPLALPLALSPTFSSLDGEGLSPTPSIADLVQFFSNNDELGMGVEFPPTEEVPPCLPPVSVESTATDAQQQVRAASKSCKIKKRIRLRKQDKPSVDEELQDSYTTMRPNLEEVEEQLFISFTSKEALKLHVPESSEGPGPAAEDHSRTENLAQVEVQPQLWAEVQPQQVSPHQPAQSPLQTTMKDSPQPQKPQLESEIQPGPTDEVQLQTEGSPQPPSQTGALKTIEAQQRLEKEVLPKPFIEPAPERRPPKGPRRSLTKFKQAPVEERETVAEADTQEEEDQTIVASEKILLRDVKMMRHRQVIHPVLQEVGLKMNLLDPTLTIDLKYLGVRLPIPPPGVPLLPLTQEDPLKHSVSPVFVSRTGKTSDVTQIKGWREKFTPSEPSSVPEADKPEVAPVMPETTKKNLSAFCSDMLDEYLENEGKLIDQRAATFSDHLVEAPAFQLPLNRSLSRPLNTALSSSSPLISGFVPPSKRPKLPTREPKMSRKGERRQRILKKNKSSPNPPAIGPTESIPSVQTTSTSPEVPPPSSEPGKEKTPPEPLKRKKRFKPKSSTQSLDLPRPSADMAPLESDIELDPSDKSSRQPVMTRALLKQRDLEDGVMWEGRPRTCVTEERAAIALTSLFTLSGFVSENPTAPIQLPRRQTPSCLNDFCRLGCICSSLAWNPRSSHCGRSDCMLGCSCLKQKVVLLKHLDSSDSGSSHHSRGHRRRRHKKRMKMAYVLREADSAAHPAERIRTLWTRHMDSDPDPVHIPKPSSRYRFKCDTFMSSCARVRVFRGKKAAARTEGDSRSSDTPTKSRKKRPTKEMTGKRMELKSETNTVVTQTSSTRTEDTGHPAESEPSKSAVQDPTQILAAKPKFTKLSDLLKNLTIMAECSWDSVAERNTVIMTLCKFLAQGRLDKPLWIQNYLIRPFTYTVNEAGEEPYIQYRVYISKPPIGRNHLAKSGSSNSEEPKETAAGPVEEVAQEVKEEAPVEDWQRALDPDTDDTDSLEDWQREVVSDDVDEEEPDQQVMAKDLALPFLSRVSPAGFLSASLKQTNNSDVVQVNGKFYPLAKIQLGMMGALHPANRLAAYLTGRVGVAKRPPSSSSSVDSAQTTSTPPVTSASTFSSSEPPQTSSSTPNVTSASTPSSSGPKIEVTFPAPPALLTSAVVQSSAQLIPLPVVPVPSSQKMVLKPVQTKSGEKLFRRPDGKLVKLVPISQLKTVGFEAQKGLSTSPTLQCTVPTTTVPRHLSSAPAMPVTCGVSGLKNFISPQNLVVVRSSSNQVKPKGMCTFKILSQSPKQSQMFVRIHPTTSVSTASTPTPPTTPAGPAPVPLAAPKIEEVEVTPAPVSDPQPAAEDLSLAPSAPPTGSHGSGPHTEQEENTEVTTEEYSSDRETENSSGNDEENTLKDEHRLDHNQRERRRRREQMNLFEDLRRVVGLENPVSRVSVLDKATTEIQTLAAAELDLLMTKRSLRQKRDDLLDTIAPSSGGSGPSHLSIKCSNEEDPGTASTMETISGSPEETWDQDESTALEVLRSLLHQTQASDLQLLDQVRQEITAQRDLMRKLSGVKKRLKQRRESLVRQISADLGQSRKTILTEHQPSHVEMREGAGASSSAPVNQTGKASGSTPLLPAADVSLLSNNPPPTDIQNTKESTQKPAETPTIPGVAFAALPGILVPDPPAESCPADVTRAEVSNPRQEKEAGEGLTTLLHELTFLNQKSMRLLPRKRSSPDRAAPLLRDHAHNQTPYLLDSQGGLNGHLETQLSVESAGENLKGGVLAPPPLLQRRVDAPKNAEPDVVSSQSSEDGVAWRPMPRLVPLGLKGAPST